MTSTTRKANLLNAIAPVNRGLQMSENQRKAIFLAVAYLEELNPTPAPTETPELLDGDWLLLFTTSQELLGIDRFPFYKLGNIYQCLRVAEGKIFNVAEIKGLPLLGGLVSVCANFTVVSEKRVKVNFERLVAGSQSLVGYQNVKSFIDTLRSPKKLLAIDFQIKREDQKGWLETTYLDRDLRIGRGNEGNLFVLRRI
ncbi:MULTISPECIES: PAP/fibrillin family protein [Pseudanabaena]|uniref:PAP fibrillin family protein n=2 Tax=Pseudanabaena TaxID=1152 RepID=L8MXP7_9CYAN|nr:MULTISPECIES: PAP/fibrillin family protein [Pseudanabaena]ELS31240.1 PAP fibrillin family protein [Pseudanabaena biceps PCC 7429]MDG3496490.1 PAP/fibrillin family protein [Pseudanabaena catenata USMAC16]